MGQRKPYRFLQAPASKAPSMTKQWKCWCGLSSVPKRGGWRAPRRSGN